MLVCGCRNASVSYNAAHVAVLADDKLGMLNCFGNNFTVSHTRVADVFVKYIFQYLPWCSAGPMYHPSVPCVSQLLRLSGGSKATTLVPGGANGVVF